MLGVSNYTHRHMYMCILTVLRTHVRYAKLLVTSTVHGTYILSFVIFTRALLVATRGTVLTTTDSRNTTTLPSFSLGLNALQHAFTALPLLRNFNTAPRLPFLTCSGFISMVLPNCATSWINSPRTSLTYFIPGPRRVYVVIMRVIAVLARMRLFWSRVAWNSSIIACCTGVGGREGRER